jgi:hypothetical protein
VHFPLPSHVPVVPHVEAVMGMHIASGSLPPGTTSTHAPPLPGTAHDVQLGQLGEPQQTCSTQWPLTQSVPIVQALPFGSRFVHDPPAHVSPVTQSPSPVHVVRQAALAPHMYAPQLWGVCLQAPAPVQNPVGVSVDIMHVAVPHDVVAGALRQAPAPSQVPAKPHGGLGVHWPWGSEPPAATALHVPSRPAMLHAWHVPHVAVAQHTPSTQASFVRQSPSAAQGWPRRFLLPHLLTVRSQMLGDAQSVSAMHVVLQVVPLHA